MNPFLESLRASKLLSPEAVDDIARSHAESDDPARIAAPLVEADMLTGWQVERLVAGQTAFFLGRYKLLDHLGEGGMGTVFQAQQTGLARIVAVKVMSEKLFGDPSAVRRFQREIQAAAALDHPNIVRAIDADCVHDVHFLVMEFVAGRSLSEIAQQQGRLPVHEACEYVRQTALGLEHAHERRMVHRDIKPSNLLVTADDKAGSPNCQVKILDFGLARFESKHQDSGALTETGQVLGTPDYISPEQAVDAQSADFRTDIYSLGCVLFRLLTGELPFRQPSMMNRMMVRVNEDAPRMRSLVSELPEELDGITARMMARNPDDRFASCREVAEAMSAYAGPIGIQRQAVVKPPSDFDPTLQAFFKALTTEADSKPIHDPYAKTALYDEENTDRAPQPRSQAQREIDRRTQVERKRRLRLLQGTAFSVLLLAALLFWKRAGVTTLTVELPEAERDGVLMEVDGREHPLPSSGEIVIERGPGARSLRLTRPGYLPIEQEWQMERGDVINFSPQWEPTPDTIRAVEFQQLARRVAEAAAKANVDDSVRRLLRDIVAYRLRQRVSDETNKAVSLPRSLPAFVDALRRDDIPKVELRAARNADGEPPPELVAVLGNSRFSHGGRLDSMAFSPDGTRMVSVGIDDLHVRLWDLSDGREVARLNLHQHDRTHGRPHFLNGGNELLVSSLLLDANTLQLKHKFPAPTFGQYAVDTSAGRYLLLNSAGEGRLRTRSFDLSTREEIGEPAEFDSYWAGNLVVNVKANTFALSNGGLLDIRNLQNGELIAHIEAHDDAIQDLRFTPDGQTLCSIARGAVVKKWDAKTGTEKEHIELEQGGTSPVLMSFNADLSFIAGTQADNWCLWELPSGRRLFQHANPYQTDDFRMAVSRDGKRLAAVAHAMRVFDVPANRELFARTGHIGGVNSVGVSPDGSQLVTTGEGGTVRMWSLATAEESAILWKPMLSAKDAAFSPDGRWILCHANSHGVYVFNRENSAIVFRQPSDYPAVIGPPGELWIAGKGQYEVRRAGSWDLIREIPAKELMEPVFSFDGQFVLTKRSGIPLLLEASSARELKRLSGGPRYLTRVSFSTDGRFTAANGEPNGTALYVWRMEDSRLNVGRGASLVHAFQPGTNLLASADIYGNIHLLEIEERRLKVVRTIRFPGLFVNDMTFTPDARHLITANDNGTCYVLQIESRSSGSKKHSDQQ